MKKMLLILAMVMVLAIPMFVMSPAQAAFVNLHLKAQWSMNGEPDMAGYKFSVVVSGTDKYYTGPAAGSTDPLQLIGDFASATLIPTAQTTLNFYKDVNDTPPTGTLTFHLVAIDTNANVSPQAIATYNYNVDSSPPAAPVGFSITKQ